MEVDGRKVEIPQTGLDSLRTTTHQLGENYLITFFNYNLLNPAILRFAITQIPEGTYHLTDPLNGHHYQKADGKTGLWTAQEIQQGIPFEILPMTGTQLLIERSNNEPESLAVGSLFEPVRQSKGEVIEPALRSQGMSIARTDRLLNKFYSIKIDTPVQTIWINPADSAKIEQWAIKVENKQIVAESRNYVGVRGGLVKEIFDRPSVMDINADWQVVERKFNANSAEVLLSCAIKQGPLHDFTIEKQYIVHRNRPEITVNYRIQVKRDSKEDADFRFRIHNEADFGLPPSSVMNTVYSTAWNKGVISTISGPEDVAWGLPTGRFTGNLKQYLVGEFNENRFAMQSTAGTLEVKFADKGQIEQLYSYRSGTLPTMEWFYRQTDFHSDPHRSKIWNTSFTFSYR